jgi:hypothetical protein
LDVIDKVSHTIGFIYIILFSLSIPKATDHLLGRNGAGASDKVLVTSAAIVNICSNSYLSLERVSVATSLFIIVMGCKAKL